MKKITGFTLLELLVVIGIIGIIMALATVAYSSTQKGGRDARRKQDLVAIQNALEQYYAVNGYVYPDLDCSLAKTYIKGNWPVDPDGVTPYSVSGQCIATGYCICSLLEGNGGNSGASCEFNAGVSTHYCIESLQNETP